MLSYSLEIDDFSDDNYHLIGVHSALEDYQLAFFLNKYLKIDLKRASFNIEYKNSKASYSVFESIDEILDYSFHLLSNTYKTKDEFLNFGLFDTIASTMYLVPERKKIDYFIRIEGEVNEKFVFEKIEQICKMPQITTSYIIDTNQLKSKDFLIF